ncbi:MAG: hypothetical protein KA780_09220 [Prolixibacteraceae bacterium]|nr:hypothetical protein [Prolixibacteraceae bacterium]HNQ36576.1 hypothetical protein [Prolixibacteraceae bacterium]HOY52758.1 hypothetical protein [Prolixibacteraceae bacterium]
MAGVREIAPDLKFVWIPKWLVKSMLWVLWNLKLVNFQPAGLRDALYPIIIDPAKIMTRFRYNFRYSSREAFLSTCTTNLIPAGSLF